MADPLVKTPEQQADAMAGSGLRTIAKRALPRGADVEAATAPPPRVTSTEEYEALPFGKDFIDPEGNIKTKPWEVKEDSDFDLVPEGADFRDPEGNIRTKPAYQNVDFTTQTLYDMAANDKERYNALNRVYPGKVKQDANGDFYAINEAGKRVKPRRVMDPRASYASMGGLVASGAAPVIGGVGGEIIGGAAGSAIPGAGTIAGAMGGSALGAVLGQGFNDLMLKWFGVYDRSVGEEVKELALSGGVGAGATAVGRAVGAAHGFAAEGKGLMPAATAKFLGSSSEPTETYIKNLETSIRLGEEGEHESSSWLLRRFGMTDPGTPVPPSAVLKGAPNLQIDVEVLNEAFDTSKPYQRARTERMESKGKQLLSDLGIKVEDSLVEPKAAVSGLEAGKKLFARAAKESADSEMALQTKIADMRTAKEAEISGMVPFHEAKMAALRASAQQADEAATRVVEQGFEAIKRDADNAMRTAKAGHNSGDFWNQVAAQLQDLRSAIGGRASARYEGWKQAFGYHPLPDSMEVAETARQFIEELPKPFQDNHPTLIKRLKDLAGEQGKDGEWIKEPIALDLADAHQLRSLFRHNVDWSDLPSDTKNGALKYFSKVLDAAIHGGDSASPEIRAAARELDRIDTWYAKVMPIWNDRRLQAVVNGVESGQPADPKKLLQLMVKEGSTDFNNKLRRMLGPTTWAGMKGTHANELIQRNRTLAGAVDGTKFSRDVLEDYNSGLLESIHGKEDASKILRQAQYVSALEGNLDVGVRPGDTVLDVIGKARVAAEAVKQEAKNDPLKVLRTELRKIDQQEKSLRGEAALRMKNDPLRFLYNRSVGENEAIDRILAKEDLFIALESRFGRNSPEFEAVRQIAAERILRGTLNPSERLIGISPEVQELVFGTKLTEAQQLAEDMDFLVGARGGSKGTAGSMAAVSEIRHPLAGAKIIGTGIAAKLGGPPGRGVLSAYYNLIRQFQDSPSFKRWLLKGLKGDDRAREIVREQIQRMQQRYGAYGAGAGEGAFHASEQTPEPIQ